MALTVDGSLSRKGSQSRPGGANEVRVSVVMPVKDVEPYIDGAIASIVDQSFSSWELIICDDASTDSTPTCVLEWMRQDPRISLIQNNASKGIAASLNRLIKKFARGALIARMDGDDVCAPERLALQVEEFDHNPGLVLCGSRAQLIDQAGTRIDSLVLPLDDAEIRAFLAKDNPFVHSSVMLRKGPFEAVGGYPEKEVFEDYALWLRLIQLGGVENLARELVFHRIHPESKSRRLSPMMNRAQRFRLQVQAARLLGTSPRASLSIARSVAAFLLSGIRR